MSANSGKVQGEGDYESAKRYDDETRAFIEKGKVEPAARAAKPKDKAEAKEMERAEEQGRARSHGEDPALSKGPGHRSS
jgi:hypothetical protein